MAYAAISKPSLYFDSKIYLGSSSAVTVTGLGFQPDWVWVKDRDNGNNHVLVDVVRGAGKFLQSNLSNAEVNNSSQSISAFTSDGFTTGTANPANESASTTKGFISWNWKAGNSAGSSNSDGSITSTVSVNTTAGFSILKWTGDSSASATVGHGLGTTPAVIITKELNGGDYWHVWHKDLTNPNNLFLNTSHAQTAPSDGTLSNVGSSTFGFQGATNVVAVNENGIDNIGYCFAEKKGYSKFGKYTGNGNADGTFVYTGFKPAWVMTKEISNTSSWDMHDNKRDSNNVCNKYLLAEAADVEGTTDILDFLSNGFKFRSSNGDRNESGASYIYMAFAEEPLVANVGQSIPATAR